MTQIVYVCADLRFVLQLRHSENSRVSFSSLCDTVIPSHTLSFISDVAQFIRALANTLFVPFKYEAMLERLSTVFRDNVDSSTSSKASPTSMAYFLASFSINLLPSLSLICWNFATATSFGTLQVPSSMQP